jgi:hypothetical protein
VFCAAASSAAGIFLFRISSELEQAFMVKIRLEKNFVQVFTRKYFHESFRENVQDKRKIARQLEQICKKFN